MVWFVLLIVSGKIFEDLVPRCEETDCEGIVKPGTYICQKKSLGAYLMIFNDK